MMKERNESIFTAALLFWEFPSRLLFFFVISFPEVINGRQSSLPVNYHRVDMQRYTNATRWNHHQIVTSLLIDDDRRMLRTWIYQRQSTLIELTSWIATRSSEASAVISRNWLIDIPIEKIDTFQPSSSFFENSENFIQFSDLEAPDMQIQTGNMNPIRSCSDISNQPNRYDEIVWYKSTSSS